MKLPHEETFEIRPVGIRYRCEFCHEGEMKYENDQPVMIEDLSLKSSKPRMHTHRCTKCNKTMLLPKIYPYIEWICEEDQKDNQ